MSDNQGTTLRDIVGSDLINKSGYVLLVATLPDGTARMELVAPCGEIIGGVIAEACVSDPADSDRGIISVTELSLDTLVAQIVEHAIVCGRIN